MKPRNPDVELKACWSKREEDIMIYYPSKPTGNMLWDMLSSKRLRRGFVKWCEEREDKIVTKQDWNENMCIYEDKSFLEELEDRGYDVTTLKISVKKKGNDG